MVHNYNINDAIMLFKVLDSVFCNIFGIASEHRHHTRSFFHSVQRGEETRTSDTAGMRTGENFLHIRERR